MAQDKKPDQGESKKSAEELDRAIDDVLRTSHSLVEQLEAMLERARALVKENQRLLAGRDKPKP